MKYFYCPECKKKLDQTEVRANIGSTTTDTGHGAPTFSNASKYYCIKHKPPVEVKEV
jgi:hypothetical protein